MPYFTLKCSERDGLVTRVILSHPKANTATATYEHSQLDATLDTGSDQTVIPVQIAKKLNLPIVGERNMSSPNATTRCFLYLAQLQFLFPNSRKVYDYKKICVMGESLVGFRGCLIGRDILSKVKLIYNGKKNTFTVHF